jgi:uncharacterized protein YfaS (alpha-2-macroglobulin family)
VFPLLTFDDIAEAISPEVFVKGQADYFINEGIAKLESMLLPSNQFAYWPGGTYSHTWGSIYAAHFLVEARKAGYQVSDRVYNDMLIGLKAITNGGTGTKRAPHEPQWGGSYETQRIAYAVYVLAAAGKPEQSTMLYLKNERLKDLADYSQFQLAGAFALSGDMETALGLLPSSISPSSANRRESGGNFNSSVRTHAIMLDTLAEVNAEHPSVPMLVKYLMNAANKNGRWQTTQENSFAFLALGKILRKQVSTQYTGTVRVDGEVVGTFDSTEQRYSSNEWAGKRVELSIKGAGTAYYYWTAFGVETGSFIQTYDRGLTVRRTYKTEDGTPITDNMFTHGDLFVAEIIVRPTEDLENVAVVDMLPAGFEIENPRLESRAGIPWIGDKVFKPDYMDIRDDRIIFFGTFKRNKSLKIYYALRAVTRGEFTLPPVSAEAMYDPAKSSVASNGTIKVVE